MSYIVSSGTRRGHRENHDRYFYRQEGTILLIGAADGVTRCKYPAMASEYLHERFTKDKEIIGGGDIGQQLVEYIKGIQRDFQQEHVNLGLGATSSTLSLAALCGGRGYAVWMGDSPIYVARRRKPGELGEGTRFMENILCDSIYTHLDSLSEIHSDDREVVTSTFSNSHPIETIGTREFSICKGDVVSVMTDGFGILNHYVPLLIRGVNQANLDRILESSMFTDDATIVLAERIS